MSKLFTRYLLSFILVFCIPFLGLGIFIDQYLFTTLFDKAAETRYRTIERNAAILDRRLIELEQLCVQMSSDSDLRPFQFVEEPFSAYRLIKELTKYTYPNNFIDSLYIMFRDDDYLYSTGNAQKIHYFLKNLPQSTNLSSGELVEVLYESSHRNVWSDGNFVYISEPYPYRIRVPIGTILFKISTEILAEFMSTDNSAGFRILDANGVLLATSNPEVEHPVPEKLRPVEYQSARSGWRYVSMIHEDTIRKEILPIRKMFLYSMLGLLVIGLGITMVLSLFNYSPIRRLREFLEIEDAPTSTDSDEFEFIKKRFTEILAEEENLKRKLRDEMPVLREAVIARLLNGTIEDPHTLEQIGLAFHQSGFLVAIVEFADQVSDTVLATIGDYHLEASPGDDHVSKFGMKAYTRNRFILILSKENGSPGGLYDELEKEIRIWSKATSSRFVLACSRVKTDMAYVGEAYMEAVEALSHRIARNAYSLIRYDDVVTHGSEEISYPYEAIQALRHAVVAGRAADISNSLETLIDYIESEGVSFGNVRRLYFNVMNSIAAGFTEQRGSHRDELPFPDVFFVERIGSREEMIALLRETGERVKELLSAGHSAIPRYVEELADYLETEFQNPNISLQNLAERFRLTPAHLSASFKKHRGINISDYISDLRLQKAEELLCNTQMPVKAVVSAAGYADSSSFIRKFKTVYGVTPGEYRKRNARASVAG